MKRRPYYSSRNTPRSRTLLELYTKLKHLYLMFRDDDFFRGKAEIMGSQVPDSFLHTAVLALRFQLFPIEVWTLADITEDRVFDTIEFLHDHASKPDQRVDKYDPSISGRLKRLMQSAFRLRKYPQGRLPGLIGGSVFGFSFRDCLFRCGQSPAHQFD